MTMATLYKHFFIYSDDNHIYVSTGFIRDIAFIIPFNKSLRLCQIT